MKKETLKYLRELLAHTEYYNIMSPFPVFDTEYVEYIKKLIMDLENEKRSDYDLEPVWACKYCKTLVVPNCYDIDEHDNEICLRCGSVNETQEFKTIHEYKKFKDGERT